MTDAVPLQWRLVERLLESTRRHLGTDAAYLTEYRHGELTVRAVAGDGAVLGLDVGVQDDLRNSACLAAIEGRMPAVLGDTREHRLARRLTWGRAAPIGAFAAVPVRLPTGHLFGGLCVAHSRPLAELSGHDQRFMQAIAEVLADQVQEAVLAHGEWDRERTAVARMLEGGAMTTVLQPIVNLESGRTLGVEALTRFEDEKGSPRPPDLWFATAARHGLGLDFEAAALTRAIGTLPALPSGWYLAVNASPGLIESGRLDRLLDGARLDRFVLEITEHVAVPDYDTLVAALQPWQERGVRTAVDDAGSGHASLRHVLRLRPDIIKMDGTITRGLDSDPLQRALAHSLVSFAHDSGAALVAEAVETPQELAVLQDLGVPSGQGYLFSAPGRPEDLRDWYPIQVPKPFRTLSA